MSTTSEVALLRLEVEKSSYDRDVWMFIAFQLIFVVFKDHFDDTFKPTARFIQFILWILTVVYFVISIKKLVELNRLRAEQVVKKSE